MLHRIATFEVFIVAVASHRGFERQLSYPIIDSIEAAIAGEVDCGGQVAAFRRKKRAHVSA